VNGSNFSECDLVDIYCLQGKLARTKNNFFSYPIYASAFDPYFYFFYIDYSMRRFLRRPCPHEVFFFSHFVGQTDAHGDVLNLHRFGPRISRRNCVVFTSAWPTKLMSVLRGLGPRNVHRIH